jgi:hypothetical protein
MSKISKKARHELLVAVSDCYRMAEKRDKSRILLTSSREAESDRE